MELRHLVLKDLVLQYQKTKDRRLFACILKRCDGLLVAIIHRNLWRKGFDIPSAKELYHAAVIGLHRAVMCSPEHEHPDKVVARIVAYVKLELNNQFRQKENPDPVQDPSIIRQKSRADDIQNPAYVNCEYQLVLEALRKAVAKGIITQIELEVFLQRKMHDMGFYEIGQILGLSRDAARKRILIIEQKILEWMKLQKET